MEQSIPPLLLHAATWATIAFGIGYLFEQAENVASSETKAAVSRWLNNLDPAGAVASWPTTFATIFDHVFGECHLSWRCFSRSCVASFASVAIMTLIWGMLRPSQFIEFFLSAGINAIFFIFILTAILNLIPDYLSLLETRYVIKWMSRTSSRARILALLVIDFTVTGGIGLVAISGFGLLIPSNWGTITNFISWFLRYSLPLSVPQTGVASLGIWFYSAFFTSVWVWMYVLSGSVVRLMEYLGIGVDRFKVVLDIENKPLRSLGFVSIILFTIAYVVALLFLL